MQFKDIIGQSEIKAALIQTVKEQRVSHAQLFLGPEGSGNLAMAIAYAQYLSCSNKSGFDSCGLCPSCNKYHKYIHPDLHFAFPIAKKKDDDKAVVSDNFLSLWRQELLENPYMNLYQWMEALEVDNKQLIINAKECDEIVKKLSLKPYESEYKVMIIWMPEKLFHAAAPKLLKILEEPSPKTLFILVAESYELILPTILSRTQLVKFGRIKEEDIFNGLSKKFQLASEEISLISSLSDGNFSEAVRLAHNNSDESFNQKNFLPWMRLCFSAFEKENMNKLIDKVEELSKSGRERQKNFLSFSLYILRECLMLQYTGGSLSKMKGNQMEEIKKFSRFVHEENIIELTAEFSSAITDIERNIHPKTLFLDLSLKAARLLRVARNQSGIKIPG